MLLGSIVPVVPTGAVVGAAAAVATTTGRLSLALVVLLSTLGGAARRRCHVRRSPGRRAGRGALAGPPAAPGAAGRRRASSSATRGWQLVVVGRLLPAGRIPVLLAAGALAYPWRRLLPAAAAGCLLWAVAYAVLGVVSGGLFDSPLLATAGRRPSGAAGRRGRLTDQPPAPADRTQGGTVTVPST